MDYLELRNAAERELDAVRAQTASWLDRYHVSQKTLARTLNLSETHVSDFLAHRPGLGAKSFMKLNELIHKPGDLTTLNLAPRMLHVQRNGRVVKDERLNIEKARLVLRQARAIELENQQRKEF
jgi:predicted transcriptional regulator